MGKVLKNVSRQISSTIFSRLSGRALELSRRPRAALNVTADDNDEREAIGRSARMTSLGIAFVSK